MKLSIEGKGTHNLTIKLNDMIITCTDFMLLGDLDGIRFECTVPVSENGGDPKIATINVHIDEIEAFIEKEKIDKDSKT